MSRGHKSTPTVAILGAGVIGVATFMVVTASAQSGDRAPILHEDLQPPASGENRSRVDTNTEQKVFGNEPSIGQNPSAIESGRKLLPEPSTTEKRNDEELVHGGTGPQKADRYTEYRPDLATGTDGTLHYVEVFNPGIIPFKRMTALDAVAEDYTLQTFYTSGTVPIPVGGKPTENDELFWGSVVIELRPDTQVPLPSVSPDMRILSYEVTPSIPLEFSKDNADNFFVGSDEAGLDGKQYRLVFSVAVDRHYFSPKIPDGVQVSQVQEKPREMPPGVRDMGLRAARRLRISPRTELKEALDRLVNYHRAFEAKESPTSDGDIFWSLFSKQAGVCRHRSFSFMVIANAIGIPTRYVANEAHAWVEVWLPGNEWVRIDLGGAAMTLEVGNARGKTMRASDPDPFPQPPEYNENYTQLEGDVEGLSNEQIAEAQTPSYSEGDGNGGGNGGDGNGDGNGDGFYEGDDAEGPARMTGPGDGLPEIPEQELVGKIHTDISIASADPSGFRGETITVQGRVVDNAGAGVPKQRVDIFLSPQGDGGENAVVVGHSITNADGQWAAAVTLPRDLELANYEVYATTPGDDKYRPTRSE